MKIFKNNLKRIVSNKFRVLVLIFVPLLFIIMFVIGSVYNKITIAVVDKDKTPLTENIIKELKNNKYYIVKEISQESLNEQFYSFQLDYGLVFEKGFTDEFLHGDKILLKDYYSYEAPNNLNAKLNIQSYLSGLKKIAANSLDDEVFYKTLKDFNNSTLKINNLSSDLDKLKQQATSAIGFCVYFLVFMSAVTCGIIIEDKKNGTLGRIFNAPVTLKKYLFESLLSFLVIAIMQVIVLLTVLKFGFHLYFADGLIKAIILLCTFTVTSISLGLLVASLVKTPIQMYFTILVLSSPIAMLGGCYWPLDFMPQWLQNISQFIPTTWAMKGIGEILNNGTFFDLLDNIGILLLFAAAFFIGGIFKKNDFAKA